LHLLVGSPIHLLKILAMPAANICCFIDYIFCIWTYIARCVQLCCIKSKMANIAIFLLEIPHHFQFFWKCLMQTFLDFSTRYLAHGHALLICSSLFLVLDTSPKSKMAGPVISCKQEISHIFELFLARPRYSKQFLIGQLDIWHTYLICRHSQYFYAAFVYVASI
jgi:hypothetical protein